MSGVPEAGAWSDDDVAFLVDSGVFVTEEAAEAARPLVGLARNIAVQYVEPVAGLVTGVFAGRGQQVRPQLEAAIGALLRLAVASDDVEMVEVLRAFDALLPPNEARGRARDTQYRELRAWVGRFAGLLPDADRDRMLQVIEVERGESPFIQELLRVDGIGERRMERLYCAGLFTVGAVVGAPPTEIAAVTGMPLRLAERVVAAARRYEAERPRRVAENLLQSATLTREALESVPTDDPRRSEIVRAARAAVAQLLATLAALEHSP